MSYLFREMQMDNDSRLNGVWTNSTARRSFENEISVGQLVNLPEHQDPEVESDFFSSHLPFCVGGLYGTYPDGSGWVFLLQKIPADISQKLGNGSNPFRVLHHAMIRALSFNVEAELMVESLWKKEDLVEIYAEFGADGKEWERWTVFDMLSGLLAECCNVSLNYLLTQRLGECAFPHLIHSCGLSTFLDVFAQWQSGLISELLPEEDMRVSLPITHISSKLWNIDADIDNADWLKVSWPYPKSLAELKSKFPDPVKLEEMLRVTILLPVALAMPAELKKELLQEYGPHFFPPFFQD